MRAGTVGNSLLSKLGPLAAVYQYDELASAILGGMLPIVNVRDPLESGPVPLCLAQYPQIETLLLLPVAIARPGKSKVDHGPTTPVLLHRGPHVG